MAMMTARTVTALYQGLKYEVGKVDDLSMIVLPQRDKI